MYVESMHTHEQKHVDGYNHIHHVEVCNLSAHVLTLSVGSYVSDSHLMRNAS